MENKTGKYFKYAIGEIVLVVIGILIALSINNWNEGRKNQLKARAYLTSIKSDLMQDLEDINRKAFWPNQILCFKKVYPNFELSKKLDTLKLPDSSCKVITYKNMFNYGASFRSNTGTFDAMISEGSANLITNKVLFGKIQRLYKFYNPAMLNVYNNNRAESSKLKYKWAQLSTLKPNTNIAEATDLVLISDLTVYFRSLQFYSGHLINVKVLINEIISEIDEELIE